DAGARECLRGGRRRASARRCGADLYHPGLPVSGGGRAPDELPSAALVALGPGRGVRRARADLEIVRPRGPCRLPLLLLRRRDAGPVKPIAPLARVRTEGLASAEAPPRLARP